MIPIYVFQISRNKRYANTNEHPFNSIFAKIIDKTVYLMYYNFVKKYIERFLFYMKKYTAPEMNFVEYETEDIMTDSSFAPGIEDTTDNL